MKYRFFFVDDDLLVLSAVKSRYEKAGYAVDTATNGEDAIAVINSTQESFAAIFVDYKLPTMSGEETIRALKELNPEQTVICLSGYGGDAEAVKSSWKAGACEFVDKGQLAQLDLVIENACRKFDETSRILSEESDYAENTQLIQSVGLIGKSEKLADVARKIILYRNHRKNILVLGETGTGKKVVAEALHTGPKNTFYEVNCADYADKPDLLRSELFGYVAGSFTDAKRDKPGIFELARGGTVFLDEIHELSSTAQAQIYLAVEEHRIKRVGGDKFFPIDVKIIAAAKPDLEQRAITGTFRPDLFERLNVLNIDIPPLRERPEDIAPLVDFFCRQFCKENNQKKSFLMKTVNYFENYDWPRNVRELKNTVDRLLWHCEGEKVTPVQLDSKFFDKSAKKILPPYPDFRKKLDQEYHQYFATAYRRWNFNSAKTAEKINMHPNTLRSILKRLGLHRGASDL